MNSWAEISERSLAANYRVLRRAVGTDPGIPVLAVIKANAYGHSAELVAPILARAGAPWLGVTDAAEGVRVRHALDVAGIVPQQTPEILVMCGPAPEDAEAVIRHQLTPVVWTREQIVALDQAATRPLPVHLELDTGMSRQGATAGRALSGVLHLLAQSRYLRLAGVLTHLGSAEIPECSHTRDQLEMLEDLITEVSRHGLRPDWLHVGNTSTLDNPHLLPGPSHVAPLAWLRDAAARLGARPMLRSGLALYGHALSLAPPTSPSIAPCLKPVLTWKTRIRSIADLTAGAAIGYNATFRAPRPMRVALLPVGYADGLRRDLSSTNSKPGGWTILHGQRAPILGRISMNLTTVDITAIPRAAIGDEVILLGPGISAQNHAGLARTIAYEILCGLRPDTRVLTDADPAVAPALIAPVASA